MAPRRQPVSAPLDSDWLQWGGWHPRFARVLVSARNENVAFALIDTNGDGNQLAAAVAHCDDTGDWDLLAEDDDSGQTGRWSTLEVVCVWGQRPPRTKVSLAYAGQMHTVRVNRDGRWAWVALRDPDHLSPMPVARDLK